MAIPDTQVNEANQGLYQDDLIAVAERRDKVAFERLFDHFVPLLKGFMLASHPGASTLANDVAQEVMLKIWNKAHLYNPAAASVSTWVFTLARNARTDYLRKNGKHQSNIDPEAIYTDLIDESMDLFTATQQRRDELAVRKAMTALPQDQHQVLSKVYMEGKSHSEVANDLDLPLGTVKSRLRLAIKKMSSGLQR